MLNQTGPGYRCNPVAITNASGKTTQESVEIRNMDGTLAGILNVFLLRDADGNLVKVIGEVKDRNARIAATLEVDV